MSACAIGSNVGFMASLREQFHQFYMPDGDAVKVAVQEGMVVPDTNVLLHLYRFQKSAREELLGALEKTGDRLWIPHQVGFEFHRNRLDIMSEQEGYFKLTLKEMNDSVDEVRGRVRAFRSRIALSPENLKEIEAGIEHLHRLMSHAVSGAENLNDVRLADHASDGILDRIDSLFPDGRLGGPMEPKELEEARKEAERRIREKIPPGYKDRKKADPTGDYLVWRQLMTEAAKRKAPVVFISDDTKEDFYEDFKGRKLGARRELREEMMREAHVAVYFMTTDIFLSRAKAYLDAEVSRETVDQAREYAEEYRYQRNVATLMPDSGIEVRQTDLYADALSEIESALDAQQDVRSDGDRATYSDRIVRLLMNPRFKAQSGRLDSRSDVSLALLRLGRNLWADSESSEDDREFSRELIWLSEILENGPGSFPRTRRLLQRRGAPLPGMLE
jgi:hypothetical protein